MGEAPESIFQAEPTGRSLWSYLWCCASWKIRQRFPVRFSVAEYVAPFSQILDAYRTIVGALRICLDFRYVAPFHNYGDWGRRL